MQHQETTFWREARKKLTHTLTRDLKGKFQMIQDTNHQDMFILQPGNKIKLDMTNPTRA